MKAEAQVLKKLKKQYKEALDGINDNIAALMSRTDTENLQSIVYQVQYQEALKTQINGILDTLDSKQFTTVSEYLTECYTNGFLGAMYDIHDQGIPLIFPINQKKVVNALTVDSKLSKPLYQKLGESTTKLKHNLQRNLSRGFAQGESYVQIAKSMTKEMVGDYSHFRGGAFYIAERIVRTEGHRVQNQAKLDSMQEAISETNRRREIQKRYNDENGIIPETIIKEVRPPIKNMETEKDRIKKFDKHSSRNEIQREIKMLESDMKAAAKAYDFERAAELRDIIFELKASLD